ncbi:isoprenyl transferase [Antarcticibacterium sp. 1MA-6-2]|uniref:isoprenyl transferase n=1 Tax=Antarcticibacterium sp. 1MA-6-2 TaxID=2908210 RepID=UPI001F31891E|nr:isoprenyl transferase [Antarcticibacterium sp. 1MA-6-2]UJH90885.1 isoprenyl transferase [Antarcticibacterium sp. 1MA-6-2]
MFKEKIDIQRLPQHVSVIMDGNGRWAKQKGLLRAFGHEEGTKAVRDVVEGCAELGVKFLTLYAFSTENWNRPKREVDTLMRLLVNSLKKEIKTLTENNIKLNAIGNIDSLPKKAQKELKEVIDKTAGNERMVLTLALSYGSREELIHVVKDLCEKVKNEELSLDAIDESIINQHLYTQNLPDVDLLIRTSGEQRISNFLLWQIAYAELYFTNILWPDFRRENLYEAIYNYQTRERRFGKTSEQIS